MEPARAWVLQSLRPHLAADRASIPENPKSALQEHTQADLRETPRYQLLSTGGPAHRPTFACACYVGERMVGRGEGFSKKEAEAAAAAEGLKTLGYLPGGEGAPDGAPGGAE
jgi:ribonuclease-3